MSPPPPLLLFLWWALAAFYVITLHCFVSYVITMYEIRAAIAEMPAEKAPWPDGFTWVFYKECWDIIKRDIVLAFQCIHNQTTASLLKLNGALLTLLPKKKVSEYPNEFRPISLIHSFAKLVSKVLALRLAPHMTSLVSSAQSAFVKNRCIQDNLLYVRNLARAYHRKKTLALLMKLAFDSISWEYLLEMLQPTGFPVKWRDWLSLLFTTSSSSVLLNGARGPWIKHRRGLR
jgi:hypothetical protein